MKETKQEFNFEESNNSIIDKSVNIVLDENEIEVATQVQTPANNNESVIDEALEDYIESGKKKPSKEKLFSRELKPSKDKQYKNTYIYGIVFIIGSILLEMVNFLRLGLGVFPTCFGIELAIILMIAGIIFIAPTQPLKIILFSVFFGVQLVLNVVNASLHKMMYELVTLDMIFTLGGEAVDAFEFNQIDWLGLGYALIVVAVVVALLIICKKKMPKFRIKKTKGAIAAFLVLLFSIELVGFSGLKIFEQVYFASSEEGDYVDNNKYQYTSMLTKHASLKKYGFWNFYISNAKSFFNYKDNVNNNEYERLNSFVTEGKGFKYSNSTHGEDVVSGSLCGDNLIVIMMESIEWFAIDPYNTPNLYNFIENDAIKFTNFNAKNKTNISEQATILGSVPIEYSLATINNNVGINIPNSLANLFRTSGYDSLNYFHDYVANMYHRKVVNKEIGFDNVYTMEDNSNLVQSEYFGDFVDDGDFVEAYKEEFMPSDKKFFSFFTTVTTHGPYTKTNDRYSHYYDRFEQNYENFCSWVQENNYNYLTPQKSTKEYKLLKEYKSKAMCVDNAIKVVIDYLKTTTNAEGTPLYDTTSIILYADHNAYYSELSYFEKGTNKFDKTTNNYNIPFAIFNKKLASGEIDTFCNTYDIYATICDLYGLEFNQSLTHGYSVFSEDIKDSMFVSFMSGMFDDNYYTVTLDDYTKQDSKLKGSSDLNLFKQKINKFLYKQEFIERYYSINYENYTSK